MSTARQRRRGTTVQHATFTGLIGELTVDTDKKTVVVHDGSTAGGNPLAPANQVFAATAKTTMADADLVGLVDSAASNVVKKITWANFATAVWTKLGALTAAGTTKATPVDADTLPLSDSASSDATKKLTWANLKATLFAALGALTAAGTAKATPVGADMTNIADSAASNATKMVTLTNLWAAAFTALGGQINAATGKTTPVDADTMVLSDSAASNATKSLTIANLKALLLAYFGSTFASRVARNRIVNPAMQVSQENGNTSGTTTGYYGADQWFTSRVTSAGTITTQRVQSVTPNGSKDRYRVTITVADASLAAGEYLTVSTNIEGQEVADLQLGTASAKQSVVRFGFKGPAGTYALHVGNSAANRSWVGLFTISAGNANADTVQTISVPGDTTGTWLTDTGIGMTIDIVLACGSTFQGTTGWQAGNLLGTSGVSNGMGTGAAVFEIFDVGLYADPNSTGTAPTWEIPQYTQELSKCERFIEKSYPVSTAIGTISGVTDGGVFYANDTANAVGNARFRSRKRVSPTVTVYSPTTGTANKARDNGTGSDVTISAVADISEDGFNRLTASVTAARNYSVHWLAAARM